MLDRYLETNGVFIPVTFSDVPMCMDINGTILSLTDGCYCPHPTRIGNVEITIKGIQHIVSLSNLVQCVWKPVIDEDLLFYLLEAKVFHVDGDLRNYHPSNLVWYIHGSMVGQLFRIPGYSRYLMTGDLRIYDRVAKVFLEYRVNGREYTEASMEPDYRPYVKNEKIHRLIGFVFLPYSRTVTKLDINHRDGDKHNYQICNLHWATRRENNVHANQTGLKKDSNVIEVTHLLTGEKQDYYSQASCAAAMGICAKRLSWQLRKGKSATFDGYSYRIKHEGMKRVQFLTEPKKVVIKNIKTGEIREFDSLAKTTAFLNISYPALKKRFQRGSTIFGDWHLKAYNPRLNEPYPTFD